MIEGKEYQNCRLHNVNIRVNSSLEQIKYDIENILNIKDKKNLEELSKFYMQMRTYKIKTPIKKFLNHIKTKLNVKNRRSTGIIHQNYFEEPITNKKIIELVEVEDRRLFSLISILRDYFKNKNTKYVSDIITTDKIIHFCLYFFYYDNLHIEHLNARLMDIYNLIRMFKIFKEPDAKTSDSEYIITYHGLVHTYTYYYFLLFIQLPKEKQQSLIDKGDIINISDITKNNTEINFKKNKHVKIEDVVRNDGEGKFDTYGHLIDDFVKDFPIKVSGGVEIEDDNDELNV